MSDSTAITIAEAKSAIYKAFKVQRPVFMWGPPGVGKSEVVASIAEDLKGHMIDLRMANMEPTDLRGIPFFNKENGKMDWAPPVELPDEEMAAAHPIIVLFLDEMNSATPAVQAAAYQLILNRRVGKYTLPDNVVIVAAGNRESDKGVTYRMPSPLANRFIHIEVKSDFESWYEWAVVKGIHPDVVGYLSFAKKDLYDFDPRSSSRSFATPRSWTFVSELLADDDTDAATLNTLIAGSIGDGLASKFSAYRKVASKMPKPSDILSGRVTKIENPDIGAQYALSTQMCYELKEASTNKEVTKEQFHEMVDYFLSFMMANFETEMIVMGSRTALKIYELPIDYGRLKTQAEFIKKYGKFISKARK